MFSSEEVRWHEMHHKLFCSLSDKTVDPFKANNFLSLMKKIKEAVPKAGRPSVRWDKEHFVIVWTENGKHLIVNFQNRSEKSVLQWELSGKELYKDGDTEEGLIAILNE